MAASLVKSGAAVAALTILVTTAGFAQELSYAVFPQASRVQWDSELSLEDEQLYGGRFGFTFNRYVGLHGLYLVGKDVRASLSSLALRDTLGNPLADREVDIETYGADVRFNIGAGRFAPFLTTGGAVLRFEPDSAPATSQIALKVGGGIRLGPPAGVHLTLFAEDWMFRLNRYALAARDPGGPLQLDSARDDLRHNLAVGAAVRIPLGGSPQFADDDRIGLGDVGMPIEVMAGRLDFDDDAALARQELLGVRAGVNFGRLVSVRGFYWRGMNDDFDDTDPIQGWGGEAQFSLGTGAGIVPYVIAGAGQIDFKSDYRDLAGNPREDRTSLILGGGVELALTDQLRLNVSARDYLFSDSDLTDVSSTDELRSNWMFGAGISFNLFGRGAPVRTRTVQRTDTLRQSRTDTVRLASTDTLVRRDTVFLDQSGRRVPPARARALVAPDTGRAMMERRVAMPGDSARAYQSDRMLGIPIPTEGELYVRYGPDRGDDPRGGAPRLMAAGADGLRDDIRSIVRDELERARLAEMLETEMARDTTTVARGAPAPAPAARTTALLDRIEQRLATGGAMPRDSVRAMIREEMAAMTPDDVLDARVQRLVDDRVRQELDRRQPVQQPRETPSVVVVTGGDTTAALAASPPVFTEWQPQTWSGFSGFTITDGSQFLLGGRVNLGPVSRGLQEVDFIPELALGVGSGATSIHIGAAARYAFPGFNVSGAGLVRPYASLGLGLLNFSGEVEGRDGLDLVINAGYGLSAALPGLGRFANSGASELFIEHQGIAFFGLNRLLVGLQWAF